VPIGALSGYLGGRTDLALTRIIDVMYAFPRLLFVILVMSMLGAGLANIFIAIGVTGWVGIARQTRAQVLALKEKEFADAARALGAGGSRVLARHIVPNALTPIVVAVTFGIPEAIFTEAALSFIGVGINPPTPSWGQMVGEGQQYLRSYWHLCVFPSIAIAVTMLAASATRSIRNCSSRARERSVPMVQLDLLEQRLAVLGVDRREFLRVAAGVVALGATGFGARRAAATPRPAPGERLAKEQIFRYGGGGWYQKDPSSHDYNKDLYCLGVPALFAGLLKFNADLEAVPYVAEKVTSNKEASVWTFAIRKDSRWSDGTPCSAHDFEWSWKRQLDPATAAPYAAFLYDIKNAEAFNKKQIADRNQVGVRAKGDFLLEVTLEGPRAYFPVLCAYLAALPGHRPSVEKHGEKWTEAANIVGNGPFVLESWEHHRTMVLRKNRHFFGAKDIVLDKVVIPIIPNTAGALPYENNEIDMTSLQVGDLKRLQSNPKTGREVFRYPFPGTWYLLPQVTKPPFDNIKVRRAVAHAIDRENVVKVAQGFAVPAHAMIPPGVPGSLDDPKIKSIQRFDPKLAMEQLKGTPYERGRNWPKITLSMREQALGSKPLAEAIQAVLLEHLGLRTELEVLEPRVFLERVWKQDLQFIWISWFMDYPDPHNEYFDTFYGKKTTGRRQAWVNDTFDRELEAGRDTRDQAKRLQHYARAEEILQTDVGYVPVAWFVRYGAAKSWVRGIEKNRQGEPVIEGNAYVDMLSHLYIVERT